MLANDVIYGKMAEKQHFDLFFIKLYQVSLGLRGRERDVLPKNPEFQSSCVHAIKKIHAR